MDAAQLKKSDQAAALQAGDDRETILNRGRTVLDLESAAIQEARGRLGEQFVGAVRAVAKSTGRVCVTGIGKGGLIGLKIQATLASTGTLSYSLHPVEALHGDLGMVHGDDVVIALSKSGGSELVELLPRLRNLGCTIILLTARPESKAADYADFVLDIGQTEEACPLGLAPSSSAAAMLALGDAIALSVMEFKSVKPEQYAGYHPGGALGRFLMTAEEIMRTGDDCPSVLQDATLDACYEVMLAAPRRSGAAAIVDEQGILVGIVTHGDFFRMFKNRDWPVDRSVADVMTRDPKRIRADSRVTDALVLMRKFSIDELPVVDANDRLVGLIDIQDLIARGFSVFDSR